MYTSLFCVSFRIFGYNTNIKGTEYESQVADSIICNDRSLYKEEYGTKYSSSGDLSGMSFYTGTSPTSGLGIGLEVTGFGSYYRNVYLGKPSLKCEQKNDRFTVNKSVGNQMLTNPIGLINVDEIVLAGGIPTVKNVKFYLNNGNYYWTISPSSLDHYGAARAWYMIPDGQQFRTNVDIAYGVRPVISINPNKINLEGTGTWDDPFIFASK